MPLSRPELRALVNKLFRSDSDLDAFAFDHFPEAFRHFANGLDHVQKTNILLQQADPERLTEELRKLEAPGMLVHLRVVGTPYAYQAEPGAEILSVGRQRRKAGAPPGEGNDVVVRVPGDDARSLRISRRHVEIRRSGQGHVIVDLSHGNTTLNDAPLPAGEPVPLRSGDRIGLGGVLLIEFAVRDASASAIVRGPVGVGASAGRAEGVVLEASVGDMVTVRDD